MGYVAPASPLTPSGEFSRLVLFARLNPHNPSQPGPDPNDPPPAAYNARSNRVPKTARLPDRPMPPPRSPLSSTHPRPLFHWKI